MKMIENEMNVTVPLEIIKASEIEPKEVKWLWYPYIPFGKVTLLQGGRSRRWEKQVNVINRRPALKWRTKKNDASRLWYGEYEGNAVLSNPCDRSAGTAGFLICKTTMI